jgi:hypothetical protein
MPTRTDPTAPRTGFDPATFPQRQMYNFINSIVAPHSYCMIVCPAPPIRASSTRARDRRRDN